MNGIGDVSSNSLNLSDNRNVKFRMAFQQSLKSPTSSFKNTNANSSNSFLRNLFLSSSSSNLSQNSENNSLKKTDRNKKATDLAECHYFLPYASNSISK